ncbi:hypothetical protein CP8484711_1964B, partial [Chlamydia psittaci 84-8471/1]
KNS